MDKKIDELKKRLSVLERDRQSLLDQRGELDNRINAVLVEKFRIEGGIRALTELKLEMADKPLDNTTKPE
jgi:hypothetical protein